MDTIKKRIFNGAVLCLLVMVMSSQQVWAFSKAMQRAKISGPWELLIKSDTKSEGFAIPITVPDEDKATDINKSFPIIGSARKVTIKRYVPNLQWRVLAQKYNGLGVVAQVHLEGPKLDQTRWLTTEDESRSSMSAPVGGVAIKSFIALKMPRRW